MKFYFIRTTADFFLDEFVHGFSNKKVSAQPTLLKLDTTTTNNQAFRIRNSEIVFFDDAKIENIHLCSVKAYLR